MTVGLPTIGKDLGFRQVRILCKPLLKLLTSLVCLLAGGLAMANQRVLPGSRLLVTILGPCQ
jgi:hypothetical protein